LGDGTQVLNFGVDGYGIDQSYLRYQRDAISWRPEIVVFSFIVSDLGRTMCVYGFLCFPGGEIPFPKPRFVMNGGKLKPLNLPLPSPDYIFERRSIVELPFIEYDPSFGQPADWEERFYYHLYSIRFLLSRFPSWPEPRPDLSDEAFRSINGKLLRSFVRLAREQGSTPIVVYFPSLTDFTPDSKRLPSIAKEILHAHGIEFLDMTGCVSQVSSAQRFVRLHYSPITNVAIARCLRDVLLETLKS